MDFITDVFFCQNEFNIGVNSNNLMIVWVWLF